MIPEGMESEEQKHHHEDLYEYVEYMNVFRIHYEDSEKRNEIREMDDSKEEKVDPGSFF